MARLWHFGGEAGHAHAEGGTFAGSGTGTLDTSVKRSGSRSFKFDSGAGNDIIFLDEGTPSFPLPVSLATGVRYFTTFWMYVPTGSLPSTSCPILRWGGAAAHGFLQLTTTGTIELLNSASAVIGSASSAISLDTWQRLDFGLEIGAGATDYLEGRLNGSSFASTTTGNVGDDAPSSFQIGWFGSPGASKLLYIDDFILNDDNGAAHNTWADDDKVVLLVPTAVAARDTNWVGGGGGTTNLHDALDNIPPAGLDNAAATDTSQVENAASTTTQEIDLTMTTYTAAGIGASDTVTAVYAVMEAGNSSTLGSDTLGLSVESNPAITETTPSIDVNDGTYPTGWRRGTTGISENPSVTLGTGPVASLRKNVATTRVSTCCFLGMYVSYVEGVADVTVTFTKSDLALGSVSGLVINAGSLVTTTASNLALGNTTSSLGASDSVSLTTSTLSLGNTSLVINSGSGVTTTTSTLSLGNTTLTINASSIITETVGTMALGNTSLVINAASAIVTTTSDLALGNTTATLIAESQGAQVDMTTSDLALGNTTAGVSSGSSILFTQSGLSLGSTTVIISTSNPVILTTSDLGLGNTSLTVTAAGYAYTSIQIV